MDNCNDFKVRHIDSKDIPVWGEETIPQSAELLMFVTEQDQQCGQYLPFVYRLPVGFVTPNQASNQTVTTLAGNGAEITVPDGQVRACYIFNNSPNDIRLADKDGVKPSILVLGHNKTDPEKYDVITDGVYTFPGSHGYTIGYTYYLDKLGVPTTDNTGITLFDVLDRNKIRVRL